MGINWFLPGDISLAGMFFKIKYFYHMIYFKSVAKYICITSHSSSIDFLEYTECIRIDPPLIHIANPQILLF